MTKQIDTETLREWLDAHAPVTVLDIRSDEDRAQWAIPGSLHVNAYEALRSGQAAALTDLPLEPGHPVVTVCNAGKVRPRRQRISSRSAASMHDRWPAG